MFYKFLLGFIYPSYFFYYCADQTLGLIKSIFGVSHKTTLVLFSFDFTAINSNFSTYLCLYPQKTTEPLKSVIRKFLNARSGMSLHFHVMDFLFRKILRQNSEVTWAVHHTSRVIYPQKIKRGKDVYPGDSQENYIQATNGIEIGDYNNIGPNVGIISANHDLIDNEKHISVKPIRIGKHCWIGMGAIILPEVELADFTIVGANAVVTKSFTQGYCVIAGNPAKIVKLLDKANCMELKKARQ